MLIITTVIGMLLPYYNYHSKLLINDFKELDGDWMGTVL